jgi:hypothetical protein
MTQFAAEDFRSIVNKLNEYMFAVTEEESVPSDNSQSPNTMLTKPAGRQKLAGSLNTDLLISILNIPSNMQNDFKSALTALQEDKPQLSPGQALALVTAFDRLSSSTAAQKSQFMVKDKTIGSPTVTETADDAGHTDADIDTVIKSVQLASDTSPVSKLQATKLVKHLINGVKNRSKDGGMTHIMSGIVAAIEAAKLGHEAEALKHISSMVNQVEGDKHAINPASFPNIVVNLMLLVGDLLQHKPD